MKVALIAAATASFSLAQVTHLYVYDMTTPGSSVPVNFVGATGVTYAQSPGQLTPFGMRQMYMRGREMRKRYVQDRGFINGVQTPNEYYAYSTDHERTYSSSQSYMTGFFPGGTEGPIKLVANQTVIGVPPIAVEKLAQINNTLNMYALANNFQTVPIHSDAGNLNSTIFQGYDPNMCPIIGEI